MHSRWFIKKELHTRQGSPLILVVNSSADEALVAWTRFALSITDSVDDTTVALSTSNNRSIRLICSEISKQRNIKGHFSTIQK